MSTVITSPPTSARASATAPPATPTTTPRLEPERSWIWALVESLAYAGAPFGPAAALAARRLAGIRDQELRTGRR